MFKPNLGKEGRAGRLRGAIHTSEQRAILAAIQGRQGGEDWVVVLPYTHRMGVHPIKRPINLQAEEVGFGEGFLGRVEACCFA